jgi:hypothetical protein
MQSKIEKERVFYVSDVHLMTRKYLLSRIFLYRYQVWYFSEIFHPTKGRCLDNSFRQIYIYHPEKTAIVCIFYLDVSIYVGFPLCKNQTRFPRTVLEKKPIIWKIMQLYLSF